METTKQKFVTIKQEAYYQGIADYLENRSIEICKDNECTKEVHNCESYAYFNYDKTKKEYSLADICTSDYAQQCYASYISMPFIGNAYDLWYMLEDNLLSEHY